MRSSIVCSLLLLVLLAPNGPSPAEEQLVFPGPVKEHEWLQKFVGRWSVESEAVQGPDQPPMKCKATMQFRMLGPFWVIAEMEGEVAGTKLQSVQTIGYDTAKKKYVGTWVDSMVNHLWTYTGVVDQKGRILTLDTEGPNHMAGGKPAKFRDAYEFRSPDHIVATSSMRGDDGKWITFMTGHMRRVK